MSRLAGRAYRLVGALASRAVSQKKRKGDLAEHAVAMAGLRRGWAVLWPVGDRLPYDLVFDIGGLFRRVQVRAAWDSDRGFAVDFRKGPKRERYRLTEVDFVVAVVLGDPTDLFYVLPIAAVVEIPGHVRIADPRVVDYCGDWAQIGPTLD